MASEMDSLLAKNAEGIDSTTFGTELLGTLQTQNRALERKFRKRNEKQEKNAALLNVGLQVADTFIAQNTEDFLRTEAGAGKIVATRNAYDAMVTTDAYEKKAREYKGGYNSFFNEQGMARARVDVEAAAPIYRNAAQFEAAVKAMGGKLGNKMRENHEQRLVASNNYKSSVGVESGRDAYIDAIRATRPKNLAGMLTKTMTGFLKGSSDEQVATNADAIYSNAVQLNNFQTIYNKTGDSVFAQTLVNEIPKNFGTPAAMNIGEPIEMEKPGLYEGDAPIKYLAQVVDVLNKNGSTTRTIITLGADKKPDGGVVTESQIKRERNFTTQISVNTGIDRNVETAKAMLRSPRLVNEMEGLNDDIKSYVNNKLNTSTSGERNKRILEIQDRVALKVFTASQFIQEAFNGTMTPDAAREVAITMFKSAPSFKNDGAFQYGAGKSNPYATYEAILATTKGPRFTKEQFNTFAGKNGRNFIQSYVEASNNERISMDTNSARILATREKPASFNKLAEYNKLDFYSDISRRIVAQGGVPAGSTYDKEINTIGLELLAETTKAIEEIDGLASGAGTAVPDNVEEDQSILEWIADNKVQAAQMAAVGVIGVAAIAPLATGSALVATLSGIAAVAGRIVYKVSPAAGAYIRKQLAQKAVDPNKVSIGKQVSEAFKGQKPKPAETVVKKDVTAAEIFAARNNPSKAQEILKSADDVVPATVVKEAVGPISKTKVAGAVGTAGLLVAPTVVEKVGSLLSRPEKPLGVPQGTGAEAVSDKVSFVGDLFGDTKNETEFMKRVVNQESRFGTVAGTYEVSADGAGSFGVAQVDKAAFKQVQNKLKNKNSNIYKYRKIFKDKTGIDLAEIAYTDLKEDVLSIAIGRLYLKQVTKKNIPKDLAGQAAYWKKYFNTASGKGKVEDFITTNTTA